MTRLTLKSLESKLCEIALAYPSTYDAPLDLIRAWIDESFRAVAPKKLVKQLDAR